MNPDYNGFTGIRPRTGVKVHVVNSEDWTDVDNRMSFVEIFKLFPGQHVKFIMNGRHINFKYANCLLSGLLVSEREGELKNRYPQIVENGFSSILQDMCQNQVKNPVRKIFAGSTGDSGEPWAKKLRLEHQGWFRHKFDLYAENKDTRDDTALLMRIFQAQAIKAFDVHGVDRGVYSFYERLESLGEMDMPIGYHGHKLDIAFSMNEDELEELFKGEIDLYTRHSNLQNSSNPNDISEPGQRIGAQIEDYFYSTERRDRWRQLFNQHLDRLKLELEIIPEIKSFQALLDDIGEEPSAWHLGASAIDFQHFIQSSPKRDVLFAVGQYGSFENSGSSNIFDNQFNIELAPKAALDVFRKPSCPMYFVTTEACKSTTSFVNRFSFDEPGRWEEFQQVAPKELITAIKKYAIDGSKPEPIFDVISSSLFASTLHAFFPEIPMAMDPLPLPSTQPVDFVMAGKRINFELAKCNRSDDEDQRPRAFFMPAKAGSSWQEEVQKYQAKFANRFWKMQLEIFKANPRLH